MRRLIIAGRVLLIAYILLAAIAAVAGWLLVPGILHPQNLSPDRLQQTTAMLLRTGATREDFNVRALDGVALRGWKIRAAEPSGDWVLLFHGVSDNRTGMLGAAGFLLLHGYSVVMMDARAHGASRGNMATYGWKERYDTVAVTNALYSTEHVRHLFELGVSMGAAIALQSAAVEPRIEAVVAEDPFANLREVAYDYAGLDFSPLLGKTLLRPAVITAMYSIRKLGGFNPDDVSPEKAVAQRPFPVLLICGTEDHRIPCRHAERIYKAARGPRELWIVPGASHAEALGRAYAEYERRVLQFFEASAHNSRDETRKSRCGAVRSFECPSSRSGSYEPVEE
ncbi:MAG TPA: alpha/beta hydrolase [Candidatus Acidoferrales bacterium]|nr:alpha/beta hydrolase [Candidatus Acidoferrales bacterium]